MPMTHCAKTVQEVFLEKKTFSDLLLYIDLSV